MIDPSNTPASHPSNNKPLCSRQNCCPFLDAISPSCEGLRLRLYEVVPLIRGYKGTEHYLTLFKQPCSTPSCPTRLAYRRSVGDEPSDGGYPDTCSNHTTAMQATQHESVEHDNNNTSNI